MKKRFSFLFPVTEIFPDTHRREGLRYDYIGDWRVNGIAYKKISMLQNADLQQYEYQIDEIVYNGTDINPILATKEIFDMVKAACTNHIHFLFGGHEDKNDVPTLYKIYESIAKVFKLPIQL